MSGSSNLIAVKVKVLGIPLSKTSEERLGSSSSLLITKLLEAQAVTTSPKFHKRKYTFSFSASSEYFE